jgi:hypothetical protein
MKTLTWLLTIPLVAVIIGIHFWGSENARKSESEQASDRLTQFAQRPAPAEYASRYSETHLPESGEKIPSKSAELAVKSLPAISPVDLLTTHTDGETVRRYRVFPVKCVGGPADRRTELLPINPADLIQLGSLLVWVPTFDTFTPLKLEKIQERFSYASLVQDQKQMEIEAISLYALETTAEGFLLTFEGDVSIAAYSKLLNFGTTEGGKSANTTSPLMQIVSMTTGTKTVRKHAVYLLKCVGGPADGKTFPLPTPIENLFDAGLGFVAVTDVAARPPDKVQIVGQLDRSTHAQVGHVSFYALEKTDDKVYQLRFVAIANAAEYLKKHREALTTKD